MVWATAWKWQGRLQKKKILAATSNPSTNPILTLYQFPDLKTEQLPTKSLQTIKLQKIDDQNQLNAQSVLIQKYLKPTIPKFQRTKSKWHLSCKAC